MGNRSILLKAWTVGCRVGGASSREIAVVERSSLAARLEHTTRLPIGAGEVGGGVDPIVGWTNLDRIPRWPFEIDASPRLYRSPCCSTAYQ